MVSTGGGGGGQRVFWVLASLQYLSASIEVVVTLCRNLEPRCHIRDICVCGTKLWQTVTG